MTSHELANILLSLPDLPIVGQEDSEYGYAFEINDASVKDESLLDGIPSGNVYDDLSIRWDKDSYRKVIHIQYNYKKDKK